MSSYAGSDLQALLDRLWLEHRDLTLARLEVVRFAVEAAEAGTLSVGNKLGVAAAREAHKLAGSLGSFGLQPATEAARRIELVLDGSGSNDEKPQLRALYDELARAIAGRSAVAKVGGLRDANPDIE